MIVTIPTDTAPAEAMQEDMQRLMAQVQMLSDQARGLVDHAAGLVAQAQRLERYIRMTSGPTRFRAATVLDPVLDKPDPERHLLLEALGMWAEGHGVVQGARRLHCHRNTLRNRLRKVERLTWRSLEHPHHAAELVLALESLQDRQERR